MAETEYFCPAKLNLFLAVTGRRRDGFHDLVSLVCPLALGDTLAVADADETTLTCDDPEVPTDDRNLVLKATQVFRAATGWKGAARFRLTKRIPVGAGLGGGSSDAATTLIALNRLAGFPLLPPELARLASEVGSDCAVFLAGGPAVMRGRGEVVERVHFSGGARRVLVFKPQFGVSTPWAYGRLAQMAQKDSGVYQAPDAAERALAQLISAAALGSAIDTLLMNTLERPVFEKFIALPTLLADLRGRFRLAPRMSGSGSACFAFLPDGAPVAEIKKVIREAWGESAWLVETSLRESAKP